MVMQNLWLVSNANTLIGSFVTGTHRTTSHLFEKKKILPYFEKYMPIHNGPILPQKFTQRDTFTPGVKYSRLMPQHFILSSPYKSKLRRSLSYISVLWFQLLFLTYNLISCNLKSHLWKTHADSYKYKFILYAYHQR